MQPLCSCKLTDKMWEAVMHWLVNGSSVGVGIISVGGDQIPAAPRGRPNFFLFNHEKQT